MHTEKKPIDLENTNENEETDEKPFSQEGEKPHACTSCDKRFKKKDNLDRHISNVHEGSRPNVCIICGQSFAQKSVLITHFQTVHEKQKLYQCDICGDRLSNKGRLDYHIGKSIF